MESFVAHHVPAKLIKLVTSEIAAINTISPDSTMHIVCGLIVYQTSVMSGGLAANIH